MPTKPVNGANGTNGASASRGGTLMSSRIPYTPALALGNIVQQDVLNALLDVADVQQSIDEAEQSYNDALLTLRQLEMMENELKSMQSKPSKELSDAIAATRKNLDSTLAAYAMAQVQGTSSIQVKRGAVREALKSMPDVESPIDYNRSMIKRMPISADSLKLDSQYFSFDSESQSAQSFASTIKAYVAKTTSFLGNEISQQASTAAQTQTASQAEKHALEGTLVIVCACTHKDASLLAPFVLDVDKAIRVWNDLGLQPEIKTGSMQSMMAIDADKSGSGFHILSGATYGSTFVGMVHVLKTEDTQTSQKMGSIAGSLQEQLTVGRWFASQSGGFGIDASIAADVKNLLSSQAISSHVSLVSIGAIPSLKSNEVQLAVKQFANFDPAEMMGKLATLQNLTATDQDTVKSAAEDARTGAQMSKLESTKIQSVMSGLATIDDGRNQMLDINSLMTAFEDYVQKAMNGEAGAPITYYLKKIDARMLAQMWVRKYLPNRYIADAGDDADTGGPVPTPNGRGGDEAAVH